MSKTAALIGATGLTGNYLLNALLNDPFYDTVKILIRRPLDINNSKLEKKIVDFNDSDSLLIALSNSDIVFCAVGTTQRNVKGDKEAYRKVDFDIPVKAARFCKMTGCEKFVLVSAVGANSTSRNFYLHLKGEVEDAIKETGLKTVHIMRPSMLMGNRKEFRPGEKIGKVMMGALSLMIPSKYKAIHAGDVARAMLAASKQDKEGFFIYHYKEIKELTSSFK
jgi:uncharacterized protein YbjT (DUF2867 family)